MQLAEMLTKLFTLTFIIISFPIYAVISPTEFVENFINNEDDKAIYKIDLLIFENLFIEEADLKEEFKILQPLDLKQELLIIKDQPTFLVGKPIIYKNKPNDLIKLQVNDSNKEIIPTEKNEENQGFNLFERILYENEMQKLKKKMLRGKDYEVLHSISWYQPIVSKNNSAYIFIENVKNQKKVYGELLIYKDRYLHFDANLRLSRKTDVQTNESKLMKKIDFNEMLEMKTIKKDVDVAKDDSYWIKTIFYNIKVNIGDFSNWFIEEEADILLFDEIELSEFKFDDQYEINQEIKVAENKFHFIDHPFFGILIKISPL